MDVWRRYEQGTEFASDGLGQRIWLPFLHLLVLLPTHPRPCKPKPPSSVSSRELRTSVSSVQTLNPIDSATRVRLRQTSAHEPVV